MFGAETQLEASRSDTQKVEFYKNLIQERRGDNSAAKIFSPDPQNAKEIAAMIAAGGLVVIPWGSEARRIYCLIGCFDNMDTLKRMNKVKGRESGTPLAVGCLPETVRFVAQPEDSQPLGRTTARMTGKRVDELTDTDYSRVLTRCFDRSLGLLLPSRDVVPEPLTSTKDGIKTVMVVGENEPDNKEDIYNKTLWELSTRFGKVIAGTSANPTGENVYSVYDQEQAYKKLGTAVDGFVKYDKLPSKPQGKTFLTSSTLIDLTGTVPVAVRWGNMHPERFRDLFPDLIIPPNLPTNDNAELDVPLLHRALIKFKAGKAKLQ